MHRFGLRVPPELYRWLEAQAQERQVSVNTFVVGMLEAGRDQLPAAPTQPSLAESCIHPKAQRKTFGWGSVCGVCGQKL